MFLSNVVVLFDVSADELVGEVGAGELESTRRAHHTVTAHTETRDIYIVSGNTFIFNSPHHKASIFPINVNQRRLSLMRWIKK